MAASRKGIRKSPCRQGRRVSTKWLTPLCRILHSLTGRTATPFSRSVVRVRKRFLTESHENRRTCRRFSICSLPTASYCAIVSNFFDSLRTAKPFSQSFVRVKMLFQTKKHENCRTGASPRLTVPEGPEDFRSRVRAPAGPPTPPRTFLTPCGPVKAPALLICLACTPRHRCGSRRFGGTAAAGRRERTCRSGFRGTAR